MTFIAPGSTIGILGGGQLGRMTAIAAAQLGYKTHVLCPEQDSPAFDVSAKRTCAKYDDKEAIIGFANSCDVVTYEFENVPIKTAELVERHTLLRPGVKALHLSQNRLREKRFANQHDVPTARFFSVTSLQELEVAVSTMSGQGLLKTCELGYDGKGQIRIASNTQIENVWNSFAAKELILEEWVEFEKEISAIIARSPDGNCEVFPVAENRHENGILRLSSVPAQVRQALAKKAQQYAVQLADAADVVGLLAVEYFVLKDGTLLFNEMAPRPHNSGHWTLDGCATSQFEQLIRAICGAPLSSTRITSAVSMCNLIGLEVEVHNLMTLPPHAKFHHYGKTEAREGRKMGHINYLT